MTIEEAVKAARLNQPVIYDDPMNGPMLYARIGALRKTFPLRSDAARGAEEVYGLELLPMNGARTVTVVPPERVRIAEAAEIGDYRQYRYAPKMPEVRPEMICDEVKRGVYNG